MTAAVRLPAQIATALEAFLAGMRHISCAWALTGSASLAIQGVPVEPNDIDVQTSADGAYAIERQFPDHVIDPVSVLESEHIRSHFGRLELMAVTVEIMGDLQKRGEDGEWEPPVRVETRRQFESFRGYEVPVLSLEYEAKAYAQLGRNERATLLREHIR